MNRRINVVIVKPTKFCNAECTYCSAPYEDTKKWDFEQFCEFFDKVEPYLTDSCNMIWHGGEPMLMGAGFYRKAYAYASAKLPNIEFGMQTNLLLYTSKIWKDVFVDIMGSRISTSYEYEGTQRLLKGSAEKYDEKFCEALALVKKDGISPLVISTFDRNDIPQAKAWILKVLSLKSDGFPIRLNYKYPAGRAKGEGELISPVEYLEILDFAYQNWIKQETPYNEIVPLSQMLRTTVGINDGQCPWTNSCGGSFMGVEPNGDVYNCSEYADLDNIENRFGNIFRDSMESILSSQASKKAKRRKISTPISCQTCVHFNECGGGCMRDAELFGNGQYGKSHYCLTWFETFGSIKQSILDGEVGHILKKYGMSTQEARARLNLKASSAGYKTLEVSSESKLSKLSVQVKELS